MKNIFQKTVSENFNQNLLNATHLKENSGVNFFNKNEIKNRHLNDFDNDILDKNARGEKIYTEEIDFKNQKLKLADKNIFYKIFPIFYHLKNIKLILKNLKYLKEIASIVNKKQIPYGENERRYNQLVEFLNYANSINYKIDKK